MSITEILTKIRMSAQKFGFSSVCTVDGKIMYNDEGDTKTKVYSDWYSDKQELCYGKNRVSFWFLWYRFIFICLGDFLPSIPKQ